VGLSRSQNGPRKKPKTEDGEMNEYLNHAGDVVATDETEALLEARHPDHGNNWDSDYVGNERMTMAEAVAYKKTLEADPEWDGWEFRILPRINDAYDAKNEVVAND
jgi:hypothetical protein